MNSKMELRNEAVRLAVNVEGVTAENVIEVSDKIASFILGDAELREVYDSQADLKELMAKTMGVKQTHEDGKDDKTREEEAAEA